MAIPVVYSPSELDFGCVQLGSGGPDISVDPSFGPPGVSFNGGIVIRDAPSDTTIQNIKVVNFNTQHAHSTFGLRDIVVMEWFWEPVPVDELPPGWKGPIPKIRVLEVVEQSSSTPLVVKKGQFILVRVAYGAPKEDVDDIIIKGQLLIAADGWDTIEVPLKLSLGDITLTSLDLANPANLPVRLSKQPNYWVSLGFELVCRKLCGGGSEGLITARISPYQRHSGVKLLFADPVTGIETRTFRLGENRYDLGSFTLAVDPGAPLGPNTLFVIMASNTPLFRQSFAIPIEIFPDLR